MGALRRPLLLGLASAVLLTACGSKKTTIKGSTGANLPNNGFPVSAQIQDTKTESDPAGDWGFYTGQEPGRQDPYVDIQQIHVGVGVLDQPAAEEVEREIPCDWTSEHQKEGHICQRGGTRVTPGPYIFISMRFAGEVPQETPSPQLSGRYSLFLDLGLPEGAAATAEGPDLASDGADLIYQVVFGNPGALPGVDPRAVELSVLDYTTDLFLYSSARAWLHEDFVTWAIPLWEIPGRIRGLRGGAFMGDAAEQGDVELGNHDVAPGAQHAPYGWISNDSIAQYQTERPQEQWKADAATFLSDLQGAARSGGGQTLYELLHPAVVSRYGEERCRKHLARSGDTTRSYTVIDVSGPAAWAYTSDGLTDHIPNVLTVKVEATIEGETSITETHLGPVGEGLGWFTDCGTAVM